MVEGVWGLQWQPLQRVRVFEEDGTVDSDAEFSKQVAAVIERAKRDNVAHAVQVLRLQEQVQKLEAKIEQMERIMAFDSGHPLPDDED